MLDRPEEALDHFHEAASLHRSIGEHVRESESFEGVGAVYQSLGRLDEAARFYHQAANGYRRNDARWNLAVCLDRLAMVMADGGAPEPAQAQWHEAMEALRDFTDPRAERLHQAIIDHLGDTSR